jgi:hypothetical protein
VLGAHLLEFAVVEISRRGCLEEWRWAVFGEPNSVFAQFPKDAVVMPEQG